MYEHPEQIAQESVVPPLKTGKPLANMKGASLVGVQGAGSPNKKTELPKGGHVLLKERRSRERSTSWRRGRLTRRSIQRWYECDLSDNRKPRTLLTLD